MTDLAGRTAVITGSSRNLGRATARAIAARGANLVLNAHSSRDELDEAVAEIEAEGVEAIGVIADISTEDGVAELARAAHEAFGPVHILVNNAAIRTHASFLECSLDLWHQILAVNLDAAFLCSQAFIPDMVGSQWGRVVNISGIDAFWGKAAKQALTTSNLGLVGLARSLAVEFALSGITVNAVVPGAMHTTRKNAGTFYPGYFENYGDMYRRIPMGRPGLPEELAEVVSFLVSIHASYVTGQTIHVNGGAFPTSADPFEPPTFPYDGEIEIPTDKVR